MTEETEPAASDAGTSSRLRLDAPNMKTFFALLANTLLVSVIDFTVWFAITFYVFLETRSVFATGMIAGLFLVATALTGIWFGGLVDHHRKEDDDADVGVGVGGALRGGPGAVPAH